MKRLSVPYAIAVALLATLGATIVLRVAVGAAPGSAAEVRPIASVPARFAGLKPYAWGQVFVGAGGTPTVFAQHPRDPDVIYAGMDVGGPMRRDVRGNRWIPLADRWGPQNANLYHTECIALDPNDPDVVYYSAGKEWTEGEPSILKSPDRGKTWTAVPLRDAAGKEVFITNGRTGKRLAADPHDGRVLFYGSRRDGLFKSADAGRTWRQVQNFPAPGHPVKGVSVGFVLFDPNGGKNGSPTPVLYARVSPASKDAQGVAAGVYRSADAGGTWQRLEGAPGGANIGELDARGTLYVAGSGVWRYRNGVWEEITPRTARNLQRGYSAVAVSPADPNLIAVAQSHCGWGNALFRSPDGGKTWAEYNDDDFQDRGRKSTVAELQPWEGGNTGPHAYACVSSLAFDRRDPKKLWMTSWPGVWSCRDATADVLRWRAEVEGHEEVCLFEVVSPAKGAPLISGMMDVGGFRHADIRRMPERQMLGIRRPGNNAPEDVSDLDFCEADPDFVAVAGGWKYNDTGAAGYSTDNGVTWRNFASMPFPGARNGRIAVSATDPDRIVWAPRDTRGAKDKGGTPVYFTRDRGETWQAARGAPSGLVYGEFVYTFYQPLESDRVRPDTFYLYDRRDGRFYRSGDGGATWKHAATLPKQQGVHYDQHAVRAAPGAAGEVWAALDKEGLFRSSDGGDTWTKLDGVERAWRFGWGKGSGKTPAAYVLGRLRGDSVGGGQVAAYRSEDMGKTWARISDPSTHGWGQASVVNGDRQTPGRVYVGTNGRGIFYGDPAAAPKITRGGAGVRKQARGRP